MDMQEKRPTKDIVSMTPIGNLQSGVLNTRKKEDLRTARAVLRYRDAEMAGQPGQEGNSPLKDQQLGLKGCAYTKWSTSPTERWATTGSAATSSEPAAPPAREEPSLCCFCC